MKKCNVYWKWENQEKLEKKQKNKKKKKNFSENVWFGTQSCFFCVPWVCFVFLFWDAKKALSLFGFWHFLMIRVPKKHKKPRKTNFLQRNDGTNICKNQKNLEFCCFFTLLWANKKNNSRFFWLLRVQNKKKLRGNKKKQTLSSKPNIIWTVLFFLFFLGFSSFFIFFSFCFLIFEISCVRIL